MAGKMKTLNTAIFSNHSAAVVRFPGCIVSGLEFNPQGDVLFSIQRTPGDMTGFDLAFPAQLHFFNSAFDYYIQADGKATIDVQGDLVRVTFRVIRAQYCYEATPNGKGLSRIFHIFLEFIFAQKRSALWYDDYNSINNNN